MNKKKIIPAMVCFLVLGLIITGSGLAQQKTHQVEAGETLFSIARTYNTTVDKLKEWNNLQSNELEVGQSLLVSPPASQDEAIIHEVEPQETLFSISKKFNVSISEIKMWNNLEKDHLKVGQKLTLYYGKDTVADSIRNKQSSLVVNNKTRQNAYYTVKSGDTLYEIARAHNMSIEELKKLNNLKSSSLAIGQKLTVLKPSVPPSVSSTLTESSPQGKFVVYKLRESKQLEEVLSRFKMDKQEFQALNPELSSTTFRKGQEITVLAPPTKSYDNPYIRSADLKNLGTAGISKYSETEVKKTTTSGELYNPRELTAAHSNIALGTVLFIKNPRKGRGIYVRINDRISEDGLQLSAAAWDALAVRSDNPLVHMYQDQ